MVAETEAGIGAVPNRKKYFEVGGSFNKDEVRSKASWSVPLSTTLHTEHTDLREEPLRFLSDPDQWAVVLTTIHPLTRFGSQAIH